MDFQENYFSHEADMGIIGFGATLEQAFVNAAEAMFAIMVDDLSDIKPQQSIQIDFHEENIEFALVTWLNALIGQARSQNLILSRFQIAHKNSHWIGQAWGEPWRTNMLRGTEVKGATLTMLLVKKQGDEWEARCVVDV
jgi:SHS2 domain-containing protein